MAEQKAEKKIVVDLGSDVVSFFDELRDSKSNLKQNFEDTVIFDDDTYSDPTNTEVIYSSFTTEEFVPNQNFFLNNMKRYFSHFDWDLIQADEKRKIFVNAVAAEFDVIASKVNLLANLINLDSAPVEVLPYLGYLIGYQVLDFTITGFNTKELLKGMIDIYRIKGTDLSFDIFFTSLGYDVAIKELWWEDTTPQEAKEKYFLKLKSWEELKPETQLKIKQRTFNLNQLDYVNDPEKFYQANKSNFVKIKMKKVINDKGGFSQDELLISLKYLNFLTPAHVNILSLNLIFDFDEFIDLPLKDGSFATIEILPLINEDNILTKIRNPNYIPNNPISQEFIYDPRKINNTSMLLIEEMIIYPSVISQIPSFLNRYLFDETADPMYEDLGYIIDPTVPIDETNLDGNNLIHYPLNNDVGIQYKKNRYFYYSDGWSHKDVYIEDAFPDLTGKSYEDFIDYKINDIPIILNRLPFAFDQAIGFVVRHFTGDCAYAPSGADCGFHNSAWNPTIFPNQIYVKRMNEVEDLSKDNYFYNLDDYLSGEDDSNYIGYEKGPKYLSFEEIYPFNNDSYEIPLGINQDLFRGNVLDKDLTSPPSNSNVGDRYLLITDGAIGTDWENKKNVIIEWNGINWDFEFLNIGGSVFVKDENKYYTYLGLDNWTSNFNDLINDSVNFEFDGRQYILDNSGNIEMGYYLYTDSGSFVPNPPIGSGTIYGNPYSGIQHPEDTDGPVSNQALGVLDFYRGTNDGTRLIAVDNFFVWERHDINQEEIFTINDITANNYIEDNNHITLSGDDYGVEDLIINQPSEYPFLTDEGNLIIGFSFMDDFLEPYVYRNIYHPDHNFFQSNIPNTAVNRMAYYHDTLEIFAYTWEILSGGIRQTTMTSFEDNLLIDDMSWMEFSSKENITFTDLITINGEELDLKTIYPVFEEPVFEIKDNNNPDNVEDIALTGRDIGIIKIGDFDPDFVDYYGVNNDPIMFDSIVYDNYAEDIVLNDNSLDDLTSPSGEELYYDVKAKYSDYDIETKGEKQKESLFFFNQLSDGTNDKKWIPIFAPKFTHYNAVFPQNGGVSIELFWEDLIEEDSYAIYYNSFNDTNNATEVSVSKNLSKTIISIDDYTSGDTFYFWIKAKRTYDGFEDETSFSEPIIVPT